MSNMEGTSSNVSAGQSDGRKRGPTSEEDGAHKRKKAKTLTKQERNQTLLQESIQALQNETAIMKTSFETHHLEDKDITYAINVLLPKLCIDVLTKEPDIETLEMLQDPIPPIDENDTFKRLKPFEQKRWKYALKGVNDALAKVAKLYHQKMEDRKYAPSASYYAQPGVWPEWQAREIAILNLRPNNNQGLPLSTFDPIFARFRATLQRQPSSVIAMQAAHNLCFRMADSFGNEKLRRDAFKDCVRTLFDGYTFKYEIEVGQETSHERNSSKANLILVHGIREVLAGEYKLEFGTGDAYIQLSRVYQTWINQLKDNDVTQLAHGAPLILLCIMGPVLIIAGGFFDGNSVLVEPLAQPCLMLPDYHHERQHQLAIVLIAIKQAVESIRQLDYSRSVTFKPALPRVYPEYTSFDNSAIDLVFESRLILTKDPKRDLIFLATRAHPHQRVLVKLVAEDHYGVDAHRKLADLGYAPTLYGIAQVEGAHTAYVMEYLPPEGGWISLEEYAKQDVLPRIKGQMDRILQAMETAELVHGDLRPNNIMVRETEGQPGLDMKLVDFDWAGTSGKVNYPFRRNENIPWPAEAGEPIVIGHDRQLLESCLERINK